MIAKMSATESKSISTFEVFRATESWRFMSGAVSGGFDTKGPAGNDLLGLLKMAFKFSLNCFIGMECGR